MDVFEPHLVAGLRGVLKAIAEQMQRIGIVARHLIECWTRDAHPPSLAPTVPLDLHEIGGEGKEAAKRYPEVLGLHIASQIDNSVQTVFAKYNMEYITYTYTDPRNNTIFYVGAGKSPRHLQHLKEAYAVKNGWRNPARLNKAKLALLLELIDDDQEPIISVVYTGNKEEAFLLEEALIQQYGRADLGNGLLLNLRDGGLRGTRPCAWTDEAKARKSQQMAGAGNPFYGRRHDETTKAVISAKRIASGGREHTASSKAKIARYGAENAFAKRYKITSPTGSCEIVECLAVWCQKNSIPRNVAYLVSKKGRAARRGMLKGWTISEINPA